MRRLEGEVGVASYKLLRALEVDVDYPLEQTCCGQPRSNGGFEEMAVSHAEHFVKIFKYYDYIVGPSVSCAAFVRINYPELLHGKHECTSAGKIMDIVEFLHDVLKVKNIPGKFPHIVCIHISCHVVRELGLSTPSERNEKPYSKIKALLEMVEGRVAVAENGCVWVPQTMKERAVMFISQSLAIILTAMA